MTLEDFEKSLLEGQKESQAVPKTNKEHRKSHHHHRHHHKRKHDQDEGYHRQSRKHSRRSTSVDPQLRKGSRDNRATHHDDKPVDPAIDAGIDERCSTPITNQHLSEGAGELKRDSWMHLPSSNDIVFTHKDVALPSKSDVSQSSTAETRLKIDDNDLTKHGLQNPAERKPISDEITSGEASAQHEVDYVIGDAGSQWRMTKLNAVFRQADESGKSVDNIAIDQFGDLRTFDNAREEQIELERRETYGSGYVGKEKPSGELFQERKSNEGISGRGPAVDEREQIERTNNPSISSNPVLEFRGATLDQTALNRLKARMMKAKLRGAADAGSLEAEYNAALALSAKSSNPEDVVLGTMENRMLAGGRQGEVKSIDNKRGRERGLVEENEDMSVEDMIREERRTRYQIGGEGQRFAERIAKDAKFDNDLDYMDENAAKLAKRVHKSELNLKNIAIADFQKMNRALESCPLCHREDSNSPPIAPVVSLATRVYLTLPTEPEISKGGCCIVPVQHRGNLLECDDDEWEEIRNFMKRLTQMYHGQSRDVIFYENAATPQRKKHAAMEVVPLPQGQGELAPAFFKEAMLTSDEEWTQHKKIIDTLSKAKQGLGKFAFRRTLAKEMPYFHVWFHIDGGMGHVVEDAKRWPKGDLFAREILGEIVGREPEIIRRQGYWKKGADGRVDAFRARWKDFDWTQALTDR